MLQSGGNFLGTSGVRGLSLAVAPKRKGRVTVSLGLDSGSDIVSDRALSSELREEVAVEDRLERLGRWPAVCRKRGAI